jgi:hypothetical protein
MTSLTGRQIVTMALGACAIVTSGAVWAGGPSVVNPFSYIAIQDPISGNKAAVDAGRHLLVSDQLQAPAANPGNFFHFHTGLAPACVAIASPPPGKAMVLKTLVVDTLSAPAAGSIDFASFSIGTECGSPVEDVNPPGVGVTTINYEPGLVIPAGQFLFGYANQIAAEASGTGYLVPAAWAPAQMLNLTVAQEGRRANGG